MLANGKTRMQRIAEAWLQLCLGLGTLGIFALIIVFVQASFAAKARSESRLPLTALDKIDMSLTLGILRLSQGILSSLTTFLLDESFQCLHWTLMSSKRGLSYPSLLGMSPTTGAVGLIRLITSSVTKGSGRLWSLTRAIFIVLLWISTVILFFDTSTTTIYDTVTTYNVTAGVGPFNGSYVGPLIKYLNTDFPTYPYNYYAPLYSLVNNPQWTTLIDSPTCNGDSCVSYLLSGGLLMTTPWMPLGYHDHPLVKIDNAPAIQMEFKQRPLTFDDGDCEIFGAPGVLIGIQLCLAMESDGALDAGIFVCQYGTAGGVCNTTDPPPNITIEAKFFQRQASFVVARSNYSITSIEDMTAPIQIKDLDIVSYRDALTWLLNFTAVNVPAPSSIVENFWVASQELQNPSYYGVLSQNFQGILTFPFWFFNANNYGNMDLLPETVISTLPREFYTHASLVAAYSRLGFNSSLFHLFIVLEGILLLFFWLVLCWSLIGGLGPPKISPFPLFDIIFKCKIDPDPVRHAPECIGADGSSLLAIVGNTRAHAKSS